MPPVPPFKFYGPIFCLDMGPLDLCQAEKFQHSLTPKGGNMGGQKIFFPPPPSKFPRQIPLKLCHYVRLCVPYKPWKFGDGLTDKFFGPPISKIWDSCMSHTCEYPRNGVNSWYSSHKQTFTSTNNKGRLKLSAREPIIKLVCNKCHLLQTGDILWSTSLAWKGR